MDLKFTVYRDCEPVELLVIGGWEEPDVWVGWTGGAYINDVRLVEDNKLWSGVLTAEEEFLITERLGWLYHQEHSEGI